jgi:hypothetical protein
LRIALRQYPRVTVQQDSGCGAEQIAEDAGPLRRIGCDDRGDRQKTDSLRVASRPVGCTLFLRNAASVGLVERDVDLRDIAAH